MKFWADHLGCSIREPPIKYLGIPLGLNPRSSSFWTPILDKFRSNLAVWKSNCLNQAGKLILLKVSLDSLPNYWFNLFVIPKQVQSELDKIRRGFFWGDLHTDRNNKRKLHSLFGLYCVDKKSLVVLI